MLHARFQIFHVRGGKRVLVQAIHSRVDLLHGPAELAHQRPALAGEIVNASLARTADRSVRRKIRLRLPGRHRYIYEPIAEQTGTSDRELGPLRDLNVIINFQWHSYATAFNQPRTVCDLPNSRAGEQDIGAFQQAACIVEANGKGVIGFETLPQSAELHDERA